MMARSGSQHTNFDAFLKVWDLDGYGREKALKRGKLSIFRILMWVAIICCGLLPAETSHAAIRDGAVNVSAFSSFAAAVDSPRSAGKTIIVSRPVTCGSLAVPADRKIRVTAGGGINITGTLDFGGKSPEAGDYQIFSGRGTVINLGLSRVPWFGAKGDGKTEESVLLQKAVNAVGKGDVLFTTGTYLVANLQLKTGVNLTGQGAGTILKLPANAFARSINGSMADANGNYAANVIGTTLNHDGGKWFDNGVRARDENNSSYIVKDVIIRNLVIDGSINSNSLGDLGLNSSAMGADISLNQASHVTVENCRLINARMDGIEVGYTLHGGSDFITIKDCVFENNGRTGIALITGKHNRILNCTIRHSGTGAGIDVEANWDNEVNNRHLIKGNYVEGGIALVSPRLARMNDTVVEENTVVTGPGLNGITLSSSRVNGGTLIARNKLTGGTGGSAFVISGDIGPTSGYLPITIKGNQVSNYDYILPAQPNGSMANIVMSENNFTVKYGLQLYRPYRFDFINNKILLSRGSGAAPLFLVLFGQKSVDPNQGATIIKGNTVSGSGVSKLIDTARGADTPAIAPDFVTFASNNFDVAVNGAYPIELNFDITLSGNRFAHFKNGIHCIGDINGTKIVGNDFRASGAPFPLIINQASFKRAVITGNRLTGINLGMMRPQNCTISNNHVINGKGSIIYSYTSGGVGSNKISGNSFVSDTDIDHAFEILIGPGYSKADFSGADSITKNSHAGKYSTPSALSTTPKSVSGNTF